MPFTDAPSPPAPDTPSGISMSLQFANGTKKVRFTINAEAQQKFFGSKIAQMTGKVMIGSGPDEGLAQIRLSDSAETEFVESARGSVFLTVGHWAALPNDKRPAEQCRVIDSEPGDNAVVMLKLPSWAVPTGNGGKLDATKPRQTKPAT